MQRFRIRNKKLSAILIVALFVCSAFLLSAPQLVKATDSTFGYSNVGDTQEQASNDCNTYSGYLVLSNFTSPSDFETARKISVYMASVSGTITAYAGIYADDNGKPTGDALASIDVSGIGISPSWVNFTVNYAGTPNIVYWLCVITNGDFYFWYHHGGAGYAVFANQNDAVGFGTMPHFPLFSENYDIGLNGEKMSIFVTYTTSSPTPTPTASPTPTPEPLVGDRTVDVRDWLGGVPSIDPKASYYIKDLNTSAIATGDGDCALTAPRADYLEIGYTAMLNDHVFYHFMSPWDSTYRPNATIELPNSANVEYFLMWTNNTLTVNADNNQVGSISVHDDTNGEEHAFTSFPSFFTFFPADNLTLTATAKSGFSFSHWSEYTDESHTAFVTSNPLTYTVYSNDSQTAYFSSVGGGGGGGFNNNPSASPTSSGSGGGGWNGVDLGKKISDFLKSIPPWMIWALIAILLIAGAISIFRKKGKAAAPSRSFSSGGF